MISIQRFAIGILGAALVTLALFLVLAGMIRSDDDVELTEDRSVDIRITRQIEEATLQAGQTEFRRPVLDQPPPPPPTVHDAEFRPTVTGQIGTLPDFSEVELDIGTGFNPDRDAQPLVRIPPDYPDRCHARAADLEAVIVEFNVSPDGAVVNPRVIHATNSCFERAALRAIERWKYQPRVVDNEARPRFGVRTRIAFRKE